jgi:transposase InsO family protein
MDLTVPYVKTPRCNRYILKFVDHFTRYVETYPVPEHSARIFVRVYVTHIVATHGTGSQLITDQGEAFMSTFFQVTCKLLGIRRFQTTAYYLFSNGKTERFHRTHHTGLSHYINATHKNKAAIFLIAYRATPNSVKGYSPHFLLYGREM